MSDGATIALAVIAVSTAVMALVQIGVIVVLVRVATQVRDLATTVQKDVRPLIARVTAIADEASKTATLASAQAQKIDALVTTLSHRIEETSAVIQQAITTPAREVMAVVAAIKGALGALRGFRDFRGRSGGVEDDDALFIG